MESEIFGLVWESDCVSFLWDLIQSMQWVFLIFIRNTVLSNVKFKESISPLERPVAYRRLMLFLDENFDDLRLEDAGRYWEEQTTLLVAESRPYNLSSSALRKRRKKNQHMETGYSFTIHHDNKVTVTIPADFDNNELLQELLRNMADFMQTQGTGLDGDFYSAMYGQD